MVSHDKPKSKSKSRKRIKTRKPARKRTPARKQTAAISKIETGDALALMLDNAEAERPPPGT
jgi:hypothetical protein